MAVHIAKIGLVRVAPNGVIVNNTTSTINDNMDFSTEHRILEDSTYTPSSTGNPTLEEYLVAEDALGFNIIYINQYIVVTQS